MVVTDMSTADSYFMKPASGRHYTLATNQFDFLVESSSYLSFDSVALGCTGCIGSGCMGGIQPIASNVTAVSVLSPGLPVSEVLLVYEPNN